MVEIENNTMMGIPALLKSLKVLYLEDNPSDVRLIQEYFKEDELFDFEVETALELEGGLKKAEEEDFDAVLLDLKLGDSEGVDTFLKVRDKNPYLPVVVLSGTMNVQEGPTIVKMGAHDFLDKNSVTPESLRRSMVHAVARNESTSMSPVLSDYFPKEGEYCRGILEDQEERFRTITDALFEDLNIMLLSSRVNLETVRNDISGKIGEYPRSKLMESEKILDQSIQKVRKIVTELLPNVLENFGLPEAIRDMANRFQKEFDMKVEFTTNLEGHVNSIIEKSLYRIVQLLLQKFSNTSFLEEIQIGLFKEDDGLLLQFEIVETIKGELGNPFSAGDKRIRGLLYAMGGVMYNRTSAKGEMVKIHIPLSEAI